MGVQSSTGFDVARYVVGVCMIVALPLILMGAMLRGLGVVGLSREFSMGFMLVSFVTGIVADAIFSSSGVLSEVDFMSDSVFVLVGKIVVNSVVCGVGAVGGAFVVFDLMGVRVEFVSLLGFVAAVSLFWVGWELYYWFSEGARESIDIEEL